MIEENSQRPLKESSAWRENVTVNMASRLDQAKRREGGVGKWGRGATDQESKGDQELRTLTAEMSWLHRNEKLGKGKRPGWRGLGYGAG